MFGKAASILLRYSACSFYNLVAIDGLYLAVYSTGEARSSSSSSNGPSFVADSNGEKYVTT